MISLLMPSRSTNSPNDLCAAAKAAATKWRRTPAPKRAELLFTLGEILRDSALVSAAVISDRYNQGRFLPDKAIALIDEAAPRLRIENGRDYSDCEEA